jgi:hypothetical protein
VVDVTFTINPDFTIVAVQFKRTSVMLVGVLFVGKNDRRAYAISLKIDIKHGRVGSVNDTEDTAIPNSLKHLNLGANAVKNLNVYARDVLGL